MRCFQQLVAALVVTLTVLATPAYAAPSRVSGVAPALVRFMLASARSGEIAMIVEVDGLQVVRQPIDTMSSYIAIEPDRTHTLVIYSVELGTPDRVLVYTTTELRLAQGETDSYIFADDGTLERPEGTPPIPSNRSILNPVLAGPVTQGFAPGFRWGSVELAFAGGLAGDPIYEIVNPKTERLEVRSFNGNKLIRTEYLRAQPGYRYDLIVIPKANDGQEEYHLVVVPTSPQFAARPTITRTYPETGHILEGRFQHYWDGTGGLPVYGYPLNDDHWARTAEGGSVTQVFERNRFEYHPENYAPYDVLLGRLGDERLRQLGRDWREEVAARPINQGCEGVNVDRYQFAVCEPFRSYYRTHGLEFDGEQGFSPAESLALFGLPLTQASMETNSSGDRVLTQWFERARFEYHPNNPAAFRILLGRLGYEVYNLEPYTFDDEDRPFKRWSTLSSPDWNEAAGGFGGHFWWTCATNLANNASTHWASWSSLPGTSERYHLEFFVPSQHANSQNVPITYIWGHDGWGSRLDQKPHSDAWVRLPSSSVDRLVVANNTGEGGNCASRLAVDAIRFVPKTPPAP